jgi:hypothetical protein
MNIAEILKYCPKGTKLYSTVFGEVNFIETTPSNMIKVEMLYNYEIFFEDGTLSRDGECVLFPSKDQRDWEKFRLPVKRGDIMMSSTTKCVFIASGRIINGRTEYICGINAFDTFHIVSNHGNDTLWTSDFCIPAPEEAKKKLFDKMAKARYKWNINTLKLEKIEYKLEEGNVAIDRNGNIILVSKFEDSKIKVNAVLYTEGDFIIYSDAITYFVSDVNFASIEDKNKLFSALVREGYKYDKEQHLLIKQEFKPFDKVLVRDKKRGIWLPQFFSRITQNNNFPYMCCNGVPYSYCISYEGNEYLLGTTHSPE